MTEERRFKQRKLSEFGSEVKYSPDEREILAGPESYANIQHFKEWTKLINFAQKDYWNFHFQDSGLLGKLAFIASHLRAGLYNEAAVGGLYLHIYEDQRAIEGTNPRLLEIARNLYDGIIEPYFKLAVLTKPEVKKIAKCEGLKVSGKNKEQLITDILGARQT
jgi:hypothetical protein